MWEGSLWLEGFLVFDPEWHIPTSNSVALYTHFSEAAQLVGECGSCPVFSPICTPAFDLGLKNHEKTSVGVAEKLLNEECWA
jgi:hypothetical protein